jgi:hypothetical protein
MNILQKIRIYTVEYFQELGELLWNNKTKLLSLLILVIILIPAIFVPPKDKNYLQVAEESTKNLTGFEIPRELPSFDSNLIPKLPSIDINVPSDTFIQEQMTPKPSPLAESIATGNQILTDIERVKDSLKMANKVKYEGKITWADNLKKEVYADKFNINSSVKITRGDKSYIKNIEEKSIMSDDNLLLVSRAVFVEIGGDPATQKSIIAVIEQ